MQEAAKAGHLRTLRALCGCPEDPCPKCAVDLGAAAGGGHVRVAGWLLGTGHSPEEPLDGEAPLALAAKAGHNAVVDLLLDHRADVNVKPLGEKPPLAWAAMRGRRNVVRNLLERRGDVSQRGTGRKTALVLAAWLGHSSVVEELLRAGAQAEEADSDGRSGLHWAALAGRPAAIPALLAARASALGQDRSGTTALAEAVHLGHLAVLQVLHRDASLLPHTAGLLEQLPPHSSSAALLRPWLQAQRSLQEL